MKPRNRKETPTTARAFSPRQARTTGSAFRFAAKSRSPNFRPRPLAMIPVRRSKRIRAAQENSRCPIIEDGLVESNQRYLPLGVLSRKTPPSRVGFLNVFDGVSRPSTTFEATSQLLGDSERSSSRDGLLKILGIPIKEAHLAEGGFPTLASGTFPTSQTKAIPRGINRPGLELLRRLGRRLSPNFARKTRRPSFASCCKSSKIKRIASKNKPNESRLSKRKSLNSRAVQRRSPRPTTSPANSVNRPWLLPPTASGPVRRNARRPRICRSTEDKSGRSSFWIITYIVPPRYPPPPSSARRCRRSRCGSSMAGRSACRRQEPR